MSESKCIIVSKMVRKFTGRLYQKKVARLNKISCRRTTKMVGKFTGRLYKKVAQLNEISYGQQHACEMLSLA